MVIYAKDGNWNLYVSWDHREIHSVHNPEINVEVAPSTVATQANSTSGTCS